MPEKKAVVVSQVIKSSEQIAWDHFISKGYTREQTAGILGNLRQEHNYNTSDVLPHGLGIAQWLGGRRARLIAKGNYLDLQTQLNFIVEELNTTEAKAGNALKGSTSIEQSTAAFQNLYERCGNCKPSTRLQYAREAYNKY